jgi:hypothetical protein
VGKAVLLSLADQFAEHFVAAGQDRIAVKSGVDLAATLMRLQLDKFVTEPLASGQPPTRALLILNLINMFNRVSRPAVVNWLGQ